MKITSFLRDETIPIIPLHLVQVRPSTKGSTELEEMGEESDGPGSDREAPSGLASRTARVCVAMQSPRSVSAFKPFRPKDQRHQLTSSMLRATRKPTGVRLSPLAVPERVCDVCGVTLIGGPSPTTVDGASSITSSRASSIASSKAFSSAASSHYSNFSRKRLDRSPGATPSTLRVVRRLPGWSAEDPGSSWDTGVLAPRLPSIDAEASCSSDPVVGSVNDSHIEAQSRTTPTSFSCGSSFAAQRTLATRSRARTNSSSSTSLQLTQSFSTRSSAVSALRRCAACASKIDSASAGADPSVVAVSAPYEDPYALEHEIGDDDDYYPTHPTPIRRIQAVNVGTTSSRRLPRPAASESAGAGAGAGAVGAVTDEMLSLSQEFSGSAHLKTPLAGRGACVCKSPSVCVCRINHENFVCEGETGTQSVLNDSFSNIGRSLIFPTASGPGGPGRCSVLSTSLLEPASPLRRRGSLDEEILMSIVASSEIAQPHVSAAPAPIAGFCFGSAPYAFLGMPSIAEQTAPASSNFFGVIGSLVGTQASQDPASAIVQARAVVQTASANQSFGESQTPLELPRPANGLSNVLEQELAWL